MALNSPNPAAIVVKGIGESPVDGNQYARQDGDWVEVDTDITPITLDKDNNRVGINNENPTKTLDVGGHAVVSGNVGIGTNDPAAKLDVTGDSHFSGNVGIGAHATGAHKLMVEGGVAQTGGSSIALKVGSGSSNRASDLAFYGTFANHPDTGQRRSADITSGFSTGAWGTEYLAFGAGGAGDGQAVCTERMRISGSGRTDVTGSLWVNGQEIKPGGGGGGIVGVSTFTSSGTWNKASREAALGVKIKRIIVEVQGGGGGGCTAATSNPGSSGAAGGYCSSIIDVTNVASGSITVGGGGGAAATAGGGGASSWSGGGNLTAGGGQGGFRNASAKQTTQGGSASGGNICNITGANGSGSGAGGGGFSRFGSGGACGRSGAGTGIPAWGSGGNAGSATNDFWGGSGGNGVVIVTEIA